MVHLFALVKFLVLFSGDFDLHVVDNRRVNLEALGDGIVLESKAFLVVLSRPLCSDLEKVKLYHLVTKVNIDRESGKIFHEAIERNRKAKDQILNI